MKWPKDYNPTSMKTKLQASRWPFTVDPIKSDDIIEWASLSDSHFEGAVEITGQNMTSSKPLSSSMLLVYKGEDTLDKLRNPSHLTKTLFVQFEKPTTHVQG